VSHERIAVRHCPVKPFPEIFSDGEEWVTWVQQSATTEHLPDLSALCSRGTLIAHFGEVDTWAFIDEAIEGESATVQPEAKLMDPLT
jgi:hypothetical protein